MATESEIAEKVLQKLGILQNGATANANDLAIVTGKYDSFYANLDTLNLVSWGSTDDIPEKHIIPVVGLLARECLEEFTVSPSVAQSIMRDEQRYMNQLKALEYQFYRPTSEGRYF